MEDDCSERGNVIKKEKNEKGWTESCKQWTLLRFYSAIHCFLVSQLNLIHHKIHTQTDPGRVAEDVSDSSHMTAASRGHCLIQWPEGKEWTPTSIHVTLRHNKQNILLLIALILFLEAYKRFLKHAGKNTLKSALQLDSSSE